MSKSHRQIVPNREMSNLHPHRGRLGKGPRLPHWILALFGGLLLKNSFKNSLWRSFYDMVSVQGFVEMIA